MASVNVRISERSYQVLKELSDRSGVSMQSLLDGAIEQMRRMSFLNRLHIEFSDLRVNPKLWEDELYEREMWNNALSDGLDSYQNNDF